MPTRVGTDGNDIIPSGELITLFSEYDLMYGNLGDDTIFGYDGGDLLLGDYYYGQGPGGLGPDEPIGGNDTIYGGNGSDTIYGGGGNDVLYGNSPNRPTVTFDEVDDIYGGAGNDTIYGQGGNDILHGNAGNDYIEGGRGRDIMFGEAGRDTFYFVVGDSTTGDRIRDLNVGMTLTSDSDPAYGADPNLDHIKITDSTGTGTFTFMGSAAFSGLGPDAPQVRYFWTVQLGVPTTRIEIDSNGDGVTDNFIDIDGRFVIKEDGFGLYGVPEMPSFFTEAADVVDFNSLSQAQIDAITPDVGIYDSLGGDDRITLPENDNFQLTPDVRWNPAQTFSTGEGTDAITVLAGSLTSTTTQYLNGGANPQSSLVYLPDNPDELILPGRPDEYRIVTDLNGTTTLTYIATGATFVTAAIEQARFAAPLEGEGVSQNNLFAEMVRLAMDAYNPAAPGRNWHALSAIELGLLPSYTTGSLTYQMKDGWYSAVDPSTTFQAEADAIVSIGMVDGVRTLSIAFRGTDQIPIDFRDYWDFQEHYAKFKPLIDALEKFIADPANGIAQVLVSGHSLGGAMVQEFMADHPGSIYRALTIGSPGGESASPGDTRILNLIHTDDLVPFAEIIKVRDGPEIYINSDLASFPSLTEHYKDTYLNDYLYILGFARDQDSPFSATSIGISLSTGQLQPNIDGIQIAVGRSGSDVINSDREDDFVLAGAGNQRIFWNDVNPITYRVIDGGLGSEDTLVLSGSSTFWSVTSVGTHYDLRELGTKVGELWRIEKLVFTFFGFETGQDPLNKSSLSSQDVGVTTPVVWLDGRQVTVQRPDTNDTTLFVSTSVDYVEIGDRNISVTGSAVSDIVMLGTGVQLATGGAGGDILNGVSSGASSVLDLRGESGDDLLIGGAGNDILSGGADIDKMFGGAGADTFQDTAVNLTGDTILDFVLGDRIVITDASIVGFTFNLTGNTLSFTGGSLTLSAPVSGNVIAQAAAGGGVQLTIQEAAPVNQPPVASDDSVTATSGQPLAISPVYLLANDSDPDANTLSITGVTNGEHGSATFDSVNNLITFTPEAGYVGPASFSYTVSDGNGGIDQALVSVTIGAAPTPVTVTAGDQPVNFPEQPFYFFGGTVSSLTNTGFQVNWGNLYSFQVSGTGFSDTNADGRPDLGNVTSIQVYKNGGLDFTITGINRPINDLYAVPYYQLLGNILSGNDIVNGSSASDYLTGFTGSDTINAGGGNDTIDDDNSGNDIIHGGDGNDTINAYWVTSLATGDNQQIFGDAGDDTISQAVGTDAAGSAISVSGGSGNDLLTFTFWTFNNLALTASGGDGNDVIDLQFSGTPAYSASNFVIAGDAGFDEVKLSTYTLPSGFLNGVTFDGIERLTFAYPMQVAVSCEFLNQFEQVSAPGGVYITLSNGGAVDLSGITGFLQVYASPEGNAVIGGAGDDSLYGGTADDILRGGPGNDYLYGNITNSNGGSDQLFGDAGNDYFYTYTSAQTLVDGGAGFDTWQGSLGAADAPAPGVLVDARLAATGTGLTLPNGSIIRNVESIQVNFAGGNDSFIDNPSGGDDIVTLGFGNDTVTVTSGRDQLSSGAYANSYGSGGFADTDTANINYSAATAGLQSRISIEASGIYYSTIWEGPSYDTATRRVDIGMFDNVNVIGSSFADELLGGKSNDNYSGGDGDDTFTPQFGADVINGGNGSDWINFRVYSAIGLTSGAVIDLALTSAQTLPNHNGSWLLGTTSLGTVQITSVENVEGTGFADTLRGTSDANTLLGLGGDDLLDGRDGDDILRGGSGNDQLIGGSGSDTADYTGAIAGVTVDLRVTNAQSTVGAGTDTLNSIENLLGSSSADTLTGDSAANVLTGANGTDTLIGNEGNDILSGGAGADSMAGGAGGDIFRDTKAGLSGDTLTDFGAGDRIVISDATLAGFSFSLAGNTLNFTGGSLVLGQAISGTLVARSAIGGGVELSIRDVDNDFNGDGRSDVLWRATSGQLTNWLGQTNGGFADNSANATTFVPTDWEVVGTGDFNGDGRDDVLWRQTGGQTTDWLATTSGGFAPNSGNFSTLVPTNWHVAGVGDFNGDGRDDIVWRNENGQMTNWLATASGGFADNSANASVMIGTSWHIAGVGDFNGDGRDDILWRNDDGSLTNWLGQANGSHANNSAASISVSTSWYIAGTGDFNGDGRDDILWRNDVTGDMTDWLGQANGSFVNNPNASTFVPLSWNIYGTGDFNGDGRDDIVWRNETTGDFTNWLGQANGGFVNNPNASTFVPTNWQVVETTDSLF